MKAMTRNVFLNRTYPRIDADVPGELEVLINRVGSGPTKKTAPVMIRDAAPEGLGLASINTSGLQLSRGNQIKVRFVVNERSVELPGRIAWISQKGVGPNNIDIGIRLFLHMATNIDRQVYAEWVVCLLRRNPNKNRT